MARHLSDIGFLINEDTFYDDMVELFESYIEKSSREVSIGEKSCLVIYVDKDIEFWLPIGEGKTIDPMNFEIHYNTHRWEEITNPEWIAKTEDDSQGLLNVWGGEESFPIIINIPNAIFPYSFTEEIRYNGQMACFVENIDVFNDVESFRKENEGFSEMSFIPTGAFKTDDDENFEQDATAWINGVVEKVDKKINSYTMKEYFHILVKCFGMKFDLLVDPDSVEKIKVGDIVSANVWISGKIRKKYEGQEFGNTERIKTGNDHLKTIEDLYNVLNKCWCRETAYPSCQADWTADDPSYGQCAITAMLVNDMFGGTIHRIKLNGGGTHYFNKINENYIDLTREQFDLYDIPVDYIHNEEMAREYCGKNADTKKRYELLKDRIVEYLKNL